MLCLHKFGTAKLQNAVIETWASEEVTTCLHMILTVLFMQSYIALGSLCDSKAANVSGFAKHLGMESVIGTAVLTLLLTGDTKVVIVEFEVVGTFEIVNTLQWVSTC